MDKTEARKSMTEEWTSQKCVKRLPPHLDMKLPPNLDKKLPPHMDKKLGDLVKEIEGVR